MSKEKEKIPSLNIRGKMTHLIPTGPQEPVLYVGGSLFVIRSSFFIMKNYYYYTLCNSTIFYCLFSEIQKSKGRDIPISPIDVLGISVLRLYSLHVREQICRQKYRINVSGSECPVSKTIRKTILSLFSIAQRFFFYSFYCHSGRQLLWPLEEYYTAEWRDGVCLWLNASLTGGEERAGDGSNGKMSTRGWWGRGRISCCPITSTAGRSDILASDVSSIFGVWVIRQLRRKIAWPD